MLCSRIALRAPPTSSWFVKECLAYLCRNALAYLCRNARARSLLMRCTRCNACEVTGADVHVRFRTGLTYTFVSAPDCRSQASLHVNCSLRSLRLALVSRCLPRPLAGSLTRPGQRRASLAQHGGARYPMLAERYFCALLAPLLGMDPQGHNLVSQSVALGRSFALRWVAARFRFVIKHARERNARGKNQGHPMCRWDRASVRRAPLDGALPGLPRA